MWLEHSPWLADLWQYYGTSSEAAWAPSCRSTCFWNWAARHTSKRQASSIAGLERWKWPCEPAAAAAAAAAAVGWALRCALTTLPGLVRKMKRALVEHQVSLPTCSSSSSSSSSSGLGPEMCPRGGDRVYPASFAIQAMQLELVWSKQHLWMNLCSSFLVEIVVVVLCDTHITHCDPCTHGEQIASGRVL